MILHKKSVLFILAFACASIAPSMIHAKFNINDPKNFIWPYNIVVAVKNWFNNTPIDLTTKPRLRTRISTAIKSCFYKFHKPSLENEQLKTKQLMNQAQSLLDQHLTLVSKISKPVQRRRFVALSVLFGANLLTDTNQILIK